MREPNEARGEVKVRIGGQDLILCAEMEGLARISAALKTETLNALLKRLIGSEPLAVITAIRELAIEGDTAAAVKAMRINGLTRASDAIASALAAHMEDDDPGNAGAGTASRSKGSRSGAGRKSPTAS